jgi:integrase
MAPASLYKPWYRARENVGLPDLRWHDLRHFAGTTAAQTGATLAEVQGRLGHRTVQAVMRYQHAASGRDAEIADAMSKVVLKGKPA